MLKTLTLSLLFFFLLAWMLAPVCLYDVDSEYVLTVASLLLYLPRFLYADIDACPCMLTQWWQHSEGLCCFTLSCLECLKCLVASVAFSSSTFCLSCLVCFVCFVCLLVCCALWWGYLWGPGWFEGFCVFDALNQVWLDSLYVLLIWAWISLGLRHIAVWFRNTGLGRMFLILFGGSSGFKAYAGLRFVVRFGGSLTVWGEGLLVRSRLWLWLRFGA